MKLLTISFATILSAGLIPAMQLDVDASFKDLRDAVEKKDPTAVKKLATQLSPLARQAAAEAAPEAETMKAAWESRVQRAKDLDLYTEYALSAVALQSEPATLVDLLATLEQQNPQSKYLDDAYGAYFVALTKSGGASKVSSVAEKALAHWPSNPDILLVATDAAYQAKRFDRAASLGTRLIAAVGKKAKPEGVPAAEWERKKSGTLSHAYFVAGMSYYLENNFGDATKTLQAGLPYLKGGDESTQATALYALCVSKYREGRQGMNRSLMLDGAGFCDQAAKLRSNVAQQAWSNAHQIRTEAEQMARGRK